MDSYEGMSYVKTGGATPVRDVSYAKVVLERRNAGVTFDFVFLEDSTRFSLQQIWSKADKYAKGLLALGVQRGDVLAVLSCVSAENVILYLASASIGVAFSHPFFTVPKYKSLTSLLPKLTPDVVVIGSGGNDETMEVVKSIKEDDPESLKGIRHIFYDGSVGGRKIKDAWITPLEELIELGSSVPDEELSAARALVQPSDTIFLMSTSGSTGIPKLVMISQRTAANSVLQSASLPRKIGTTLLGCLDIEAMTYILILQFFFGNGVKAVITSEATILQCDAKAVADAIVEEQVNMTVLQKGFPRRLVDLCRTEGYELPSLQAMMLTGQHVSSSLVTGIMQYVKCAPMVSYGQSECALVAGPGLAKPQVYQPLPIPDHTEIKIVDDNEELLPLGCEGEILIRSFYVMSGYRNNLEVTKKALTEDNYLRTGDIGVLNNDKMLELRGRKEDALRFKVNQKTVYSSAIEEVLSTYPGVHECAVVASTTSGYYGDEVTYCISLDSSCDKELDEKDLIAHVLSQTNELSKPCRIHYIDSLPWTDNGRKVSRKKLRYQLHELIKNDENYGITEWYREYMGNTAQRTDRNV